MGREAELNIGIIGGGNVGAGLAERCRRAGHEVLVSTRDTVAETSRGAEVVVLAIPATAIAEVVPQLDVGGKVLVDATNAVRGGGTNADVRRLARGARVVNAFNTNFAGLYDRLDDVASPPTMLYCGDDAGARETVAALIQDAGYEPADAGGLEQAANVEAFAAVLINMTYNVGRGRFFYRFADR